MVDFKTIAYLKIGNQRQQEAYQTLRELAIFDVLADYKPVLAGTIPIGIDIPTSDLDIICQCENHVAFTADLTRLFHHQKAFDVHTKVCKQVVSTIARFKTSHFDIEIFGQAINPTHQYAYRHMIIEHQILQEKGEHFRARIKQLKLEGLKTEPAFAYLLGLKGNPYEALLNYVWREENE